MVNLQITVITVCYNSFDAIEKTIQSVLGQTYPNIEYIIIDGASTDGTVDVIRKYESKIAKFISEPDKGIYDAMNKGISLATGQWTIFMNAGDAFHNVNVISSIFSSVKSDKLALIYGDVELDFGKIGLLRKFYSNVSRDDLPFEVCHQSLFTRTSLLKKYKYNTLYKIAADQDCVYRIMNDGFESEYIQIVVSDFCPIGGVSAIKVEQLKSEIRKIKGITTNQISFYRKMVDKIKNILALYLPSDWYYVLRYKAASKQNKLFKIIR